jgi:subtilase family serine protease
MKTKNLVAIQCAFLFALLSIPALQASAQNAGVQPRITQAVDESKLTLLKGNTHPLARAEFDRGPAPAGLPMERMLLVLKRSPAQETALAGLLAQQMDKTSPNFHKWLTPAQFGQQFGPADQDIQIITSWLGSQGFQVAKASNGRSLIEFSGNAGQVQQAFHTAIHSYVVNGEQHWANSSDPQIPSALTPVVAGISTLHNFVKKPHVRFSELQGTGKAVAGKNPAINFGDGTHGVAPADFAQIYSVPNCFSTKTPQFCGDGVTIAIVGRSNINVADVQNFRTLFFNSLVSPSPFTSANIILDGPDPGNLGGGEEVEAVLDSSWSGAVAPNATIDLVVSETTEVTDGVDLSEVFIIDNNLAPVMSESFGACEALVGQAQATIESNLAEQAAAQGITFLASTGDTGAEGCDDSSETIATQPIGVNIPAALPWTLAVGGTQFIANDSAFWSATQGPDDESALSYIPENVWNQSCLAAQCGPNNSPNIAAGGGGQSVLFPKPVWQTGVPGLPTSNFRAIPDVSLNTSDVHDPTVLCVLDIQQTFNPPSSCVPNSQGEFSVIAVGGTSVSTPSFAGIIALVNQETQDRQGQAGFVMYKLAAAETFSSCNASSTPPPSTCIFNNVTVGNNAVPGETGFGASTAKFQAGQGYNEATGFGSVNAAALLSNWASARSQASQTSLTIPTTFPVTHGANVTIDIAVAHQSGTGTPTGDVALIANSSSQSGGITLATFTLNASGDVATTTDVLAGGTYTVTAHYEGDGTFLPSDSSPVSVNIGKESSKTQAEIVTTDPNTGQVISNNATTVPYGLAFYLLRVNVTSSSSTASCSQNSEGESGCATGNVQLTDNGGPLDGGTFVLNSLGIAEDQAIQLPVGSHSLVASYAGSSSFSSSVSATDAVTVTQANTTSTLSANPTTVLSGGLVTLTAVVNTQSTGVAPTGTVQFLNGSTPITGTVTLTPVAGSQNGPASLTATLTTTLSALSGPQTNLWRTPNPPRIFVGMLAYAIFVFLLFLIIAPRKKLRGAAYMALLFFAVAIVAGAGCGGGSSTKTPNSTSASLTAKYSGDTNYVSSSSPTVIVTIQ